MKVPKITFMLVNKNIPFIFLIPPLDLRITSGQKTQSVDIIDFGEVVNIGKKTADTIEFSTYLPFLTSPFFSELNQLLPSLAIELLKKWKEDGDSLRFIVPEYHIIYNCKITTLTTSIPDFTGDRKITLKLTEDRKHYTLIDEITGLFKRGAK